MRRAALVALLALAAGACSDDDEATPTTSTATTAASTTTTSSSSSTTSTTTCPPPNSSEVPVASVDLDGDGVDERLVPAGSGAAVDIVELRRVDGCDEVPVTLDGVPAQFAIGGSVLLLQGLRCEDDHLVHLGATSEDGETYTTLDITYELQGDELVMVDDRSGQLAANDPALQAYSTLDC